VDYEKVETYLHYREASIVCQPTVFPNASLCTSAFLRRRATSDNALGKHVFTHRRSIYVRCDCVGHFQTKENSAIVNDLEER
jgi:hypothetical protein